MKLSTQHRFYYSELLPLEAPMTIEILNLRENQKVSKPSIISWPIYENGKMKIITMPNPIAFEKIYNNWILVEKDIFKKFNSYTFSTTQLPIDTYKKDVHKSAKVDLFSSRYFKYKNTYTYSDLKKKAFNSRANGYVSIFDIKSFFPSIYIHSIEWTFYKQPLWKVKKIIDGKDSVPINELAKNIHELAKKLSGLQTNGLPIGPNLSRIICQFIGFEIDKMIHEAFQENKIKGVKIYRFIDDVFVVHSQKVDKKSIINSIEQKLIKYSMKINQLKVEVNLQEDDDDFLQRLLDEPWLNITKWINKLKKYASISKKEMEENPSKSFYNEFSSHLKDTVVVANKDCGDFLKYTKALNFNLMLKAFLLISKRNLYSDTKIIKAIENYSFNLVKIALKWCKNDAAILNSISPLLFIIYQSKKTKKRADVIDRLKKVKIVGREEILFPFLSAMFPFDQKRISNIFANYYNLAWINGSKRISTQENIIEHISSSFVY